MAATGQTINDRLNAVRYALVGQGLARTVCKATTLEVLGPKKKHIDYLIACTNEPNVSTPQLANLLIERTQHTNWAVVFKALISIHHLMSYGNERFTQYLATSNHSFELADFMDRTTPQGYNMSTFVRRYAKYINDKSISYRTLAIDLCKISRGNDNALRTMNMDNLSKTLPIVQAQFDSLLEFCAEPKDLNNGVIMAAFRLLYKDLVKLYVAYQEAIINLLERYFKLSRKKTREALEMYKNYLTRMDKVAGFLRVVDAVGLDKSEMPDLTKSPASILKLLEQHLAQLEAKKRGTTPVEQAEEEQQQSKENELEIVADGKQEQSSEVVKPSVAVTEEEKPQEKPPAPQKPARPSPKASPKATTKISSPVSPPELEKAHQDSPAKPVPTEKEKEKEKKGPPERPAKPPSRPPPPSASAAPATTPKPPPPPPGPPAHSPTPPPPHPPPPAHHSPAVPPSNKPEQKLIVNEEPSGQQSTEAQEAQAQNDASEVAGESSNQDESHTSNLSTANGSQQDTTAGETQDNDLPTCSSVSRVEEENVIVTDQDAPIANHVSENNDQQHGEEELPPPIEDENVEPAAEQISEEDAADAQVEPSEPSGTDAASAE